MVNNSFLSLFFSPKICIAMLILLCGAVCLLVLLLPFMPDRGFCLFVIYPWTFHGVHTIFAVSFIKIISGRVIICGPAQVVGLLVRNVP